MMLLKGGLFYVFWSQKWKKKQLSKHIGIEKNEYMWIFLLKNAEPSTSGKRDDNDI